MSNLRDLVAKLRLDTTAFTKGLRGVSSKLKAIGAVMSEASAGMVLAVKGQIDAADQLGETAQKLGVSTEALSKLRYAAELSGVEFADLSIGLRKLTQNMAAAAGGNKQAAAMFADLGVQVQNADGSLREADQVLADIAEVLSKMPDGAEKSALSMNLLGRSGTELVPLLNQGREGIRRLSEEAASMGLVISSETAGAAGDFNDSLDGIRKTVGGLVVQLAAELAPVLRDVAEWLLEQTKFLRDLDPDTRKWATALALVAAAAGTVVLAVGLLIAPLTTVLGLMKALALAALANPLIALGAAAVVGAGLIYYYWGDIKEWFADIWASIKAKAADLWRGIGQMASDAVTETLNAWTGVKELFALTLLNIKTAFDEGWANIKAVTAQWVTDFLAIGGQIVEGLKQGILEKWDAMVSWFKGKADELTANFRSWFGVQSPSRVFRQIGQFMMEGLSLGIGQGMGGVRSAMSVLADDVARQGDAVGSTFQRIGRWFVDLQSGATTVGETVSRTLSNLSRQMGQAAFQDLTRLATGALGQVGGGLLSGVLGAVLGFAEGGVFDAGRLQKFANGGIVQGATAFAMGRGLGVMGEAGPEAIMPLTRGRNGKLGVQAAGGSSSVMIALAPGLEASILRQARGQAIQIVQAGNAAQQRGLGASLQDYDARGTT